MLVKESTLAKVIETALDAGADFAEVYVEDTRRRQCSILNGGPDRAISGHTLGAGVRLFSGTEQIYTFTNDLSEEGLLRSAKKAATALKATNKGRFTAPTPIETFGTTTRPRLSADDFRWRQLKVADESARAVSHLITQVEVNLSETVKLVQIMNSEGLNRADARNYLGAFARAVSEDGGQMESGHEREAFLGLESDWEKVDFRALGEKAATQSIGILKAQWAPAGELPVLLNSGFGGVIFHEACGHGLETTSVSKNASVFCGKLNQMVASDVVTAIDDGTIDGQYGSLVIDDEGETTRRTTLIERGILKSYLVDKIGARKTGHQVTGSGRRQDYRFAPTSRMRNTFIAPGNSSFEEMIKDIDYGLYAETLGGGSVKPGTGSYNFAVQVGYLVRNGRIEQQVKGASLIGTGIETLGRIVKVGRDLKLAAGTCGSVSGWIPVTVGQPQLLVSKLTVGGKV